MGQRAKAKQRRSATAKALDKHITGLQFSLPDGTVLAYDPAHYTSAERKNFRRSYSVAMKAEAVVTDMTAPPKGIRGY